jgi:HSP20 family protein
MCLGQNQIERLDLELPHFQFGTKDSFVPSLDVQETESNYVVHADVPGIKKEDIKVEAKEGVLNITGERKYEHSENKEGKFFQERSFGKFSRSIRLPLDANFESIGASYKDGVLTIQVPKLAEKKAQEVKVEFH